jgi:hypothetical protein
LLFLSPSTLIILGEDTHPPKARNFMRNKLIFFTKVLKECGLGVVVVGEVFFFHLTQNRELGKDSGNSGYALKIGKNQPISRKATHF